MIYITDNVYYGEISSTLYETRPIQLGLRYLTFTLTQIIGSGVYAMCVISPPDRFSQSLIYDLSFSKPLQTCLQIPRCQGAFDVGEIASLGCVPCISNNRDGQLGLCLLPRCLDRNGDSHTSQWESSGP
jgi:hypothetical protein